jgi:glycosyltransferase involved in cell wall biosynthesis
MKILFIHGDTRGPGEGGGAESLLRDQAQGLKKLGHESAWWSGQGSLEQAIEQFQPDVCHLMTLHCYMGLAPAVYLQKHNIPHVWHVQDYWPWCEGRMLIRDGQSCPAVEGECDPGCSQRERRNYLEICNGSFIVAGNAYTAEIYRRNGLRCDAVVELGVDVEMFSPSANHRAAIGNCTEITESFKGEKREVSIYTSCAWPGAPWKGMDVLREALAGTPYEALLISGVPRDKVASELKKADIFVFPSWYEETFGLCLCEAMASGCACIAADSAGAKAQIEPGVTGLLVQKQNVAELRAAILKLAQDAELRGRLGMAARKHALWEHSLEAMAARWVKVYENANL